MPQLIEIAQLDEVGPGKVKLLEVAGRRLALCNYDGSLYAIDDECTHDRGPLGQGELIGKEIECPRHGARFDITTGRATRLPAVRPVRTYKVSVTNGSVAIEVPDA